jgi:hypothetical protein
MSGFKSLAVIVAVASMATVSVAQAGGSPARKHLKQPTIFSSETVRGSHADMPRSAPAWSYQGVRSLSSPGGRG